MSSLKPSPASRWPQADQKRHSSPGALAPLGCGGDREQAAEHRSLEQAIEDRAEQRLVEWADIDQQHEHGEHREGECELLPGLEPFPPEQDLGRRPVLSGMAIAPRGPHQPGSYAVNPAPAVRLVAAAAFLLWAAACDPVMGTGSGNPPDLSHYIRVSASDQAVVVILVAGYPAGDYQFNYNGYGSGALVVTVPVGWHVTVQCENRGTVPNSCSVVTGRHDTEPIDPAWTSPDPARGLDPGQSA